MTELYLLWLTLGIILLVSIVLIKETIQNCFFKILLASKLIEKYPNVSAEFVQKNVKEQTIENNQEIKELYKQIDKLTKELEQCKNQK